MRSRELVMCGELVVETEVPEVATCLAKTSIFPVEEIIPKRLNSFLWLTLSLLAEHNFTEYL